ncbi:unnamed protein product [Phytophthora fragariaefolia]|uniref:Unnamed protein product n=1 Tax=Phytophthora fragariaefolia TaxID=1490495 RepID=A0A9W6YAK7_9STRA|nr:unnamed protein product [Phytophthora fragariaefolia]
MGRRDNPTDEVGDDAYHGRADSVRVGTDYKDDATSVDSASASRRCCGTYEFTIDAQVQASDTLPGRESGRLVRSGNRDAGNCGRGRNRDGRNGSHPGAPLRVV